MPDVPFQVVVPTRDGARWIAPFHRAYRRLGVEPAYLLDRRSSDGTGDILAGLGAQVHPVAPKHDRVEAMLGITRELFGEGWVVRFDDDELPSAALIHWLRDNLGDVRETSLAISRRDVVVRDGGLLYSGLESYYFHPDLLTFLDPQWRGFVPARVRFTDALHTPGFEIASYAVIPEAAHFVHFDWILRSREERMAKIRRYEQQSSGSGWSFAQFYLPELHTDEAARWTVMEGDEFAPLLAELGHAGV